MKIRTDPNCWEQYPDWTKLNETEIVYPYSGCEVGRVVFIFMNTIEDLTPRQVCGRHYDYWSLHEKELKKEKKY